MMDDMASAFSDMPFFNPMMMLNKSETSATRRLLQCTGMGCSMNDITSKFAPPAQEAPDLSRADFAARRSVINQINSWTDSMEGKPMLEGGIYKNEWVPILYLYEIAKNTARRDRDWGHILCCDLTISHFLIVMTFPDACDCGNYAHHDYATMTKYQADRMMSLLTYLHKAWGWGNQPRWIRATYSTPAHGFKLDPKFLTSASAPEAGATSTLPIYHVTPENFVPTLLSHDLERIDNTCEQDRYTSAKRAAPADFAAVRAQVSGSKQDRPDVSEAFKRRNARQCASCEKVSKDRDLRLCSRCKLVYYCDPQCQRAHWPRHKIWCASAAKERQQSEA